MTPRLKELYFKEIQPSLKTEFGFKNLNPINNDSSIIENISCNKPPINQ